MESLALEKEETRDLSGMWGFGKKMVVCKTRKGLSPDIESARTLILNFPQCRTMRKKMFVAKTNQSMVFYHSSDYACIVQ